LLGLLSDFSFLWLPFVLETRETVCGFVACVGFELREFGGSVLALGPSFLDHVAFLSIMPLMLLCCFEFYDTGQSDVHMWMM
jgi:hypothetical protein